MKINSDILIKNNNIIYASDFKCKNLLNTNLMVSFTGYADVWYSLDGNSASSAGYKNTNVFADLKAGETYTLSIHSLANVKSIQLLDSNGSALVNKSSVSSHTFTVTSDTRVYPRIKTSDSAITYCIMQLEQGSEATEFAEFKAFENEEVYSTNEQKIGTWMGKPLYKKTIYIEHLPNNTSQQFNHNISNISAVVNIYGIAHELQNIWYLTLPASNPTSTKSINISSSTSVINISTGTDRSNWEAYITLEYTKTTD